MKHREPMNFFAKLSDNLDERLSDAVKAFWKTRENQAKKQQDEGKRDQGARSAVTGGAQMDGFIRLFTEIITTAGITEDHIFTRRNLEIPGYFRPTKKWDLLVVRNGCIVAAIEAKSQVGSLGNNVNNRAEEVVGCAVDLWTAYREKAFQTSPRPWLGYLFLLGDSDEARQVVRVKEPHFPVFPEFKEASYAQRYEFLLRKLVLERHYDGAAFLLSGEESGSRGEYIQPAGDLTLQTFARALFAHVLGSAQE